MGTQGSGKLWKRSNQLRIAQIVQYFQPRFGYADFFLATEFKRRGHEVCIVTTDRYSQGAKMLRNSNREVPGRINREKESLILQRFIPIHHARLGLEPKARARRKYVETEASIEAVGLRMKEIFETITQKHR